MARALCSTASLQRPISSHKSESREVEDAANAIIFFEITQGRACKGIAHSRIVKMTVLDSLMRRLYPSQHSPLATEALHPKVPSWSTRRQIQQLHSDTQPRQVEDLPTMKQVSDKAQSGIGLKQLSQLAIYLSANLAMIQ